MSIASSGWIKKLNSFIFKMQICRWREGFGLDHTNAFCILPTCCSFHLFHPMTSWGLWLLLVPLVVSLSVFPAPPSVPSLLLLPSRKGQTALKAVHAAQRSRSTSHPVSGSVSEIERWLLPEQIFVTNNCNLSDLSSCSSCHTRARPQKPHTRPQIT